MNNNYEYEEHSDNKYCYSNTKVLINKLNIRDMLTLHEAEREYAMIRYSELQLMGVTGKFYLKHLQAIHKYLFQDLYEWAGELRTVDIAKGNIFCMSQYIVPQFNEVYKQLKKDKLLSSIQERNEMVTKLAYYLSEINVIHPFREGNGRAQRLFCEQLCYGNGRFYLDFSKLEENEMIIASIASFKKEYDLMEIAINKCLFEEK